MLELFILACKCLTIFINAQNVDSNCEGGNLKKDTINDCLSTVCLHQTHIERMDSPITIILTSTLSFVGSSVVVIPLSKQNGPEPERRVLWRHIWGYTVLQMSIKKEIRHI